jgi:hypothetical protein
MLEVSINNKKNLNKAILNFITKMPMAYRYTLSYVEGFTPVDKKLPSTLVEAGIEQQNV